MSIGIEVAIDCTDPDATAAFWSAALGYEQVGSAGQYRVIAPVAPAVGPKVVIQAVSEPKTTKNRMHIDMQSDDIEGEADRLERLGARRLAQEPVEEHETRWIKMADPEGNEFCVCECR